VVESLCIDIGVFVASVASTIGIIEEVLVLEGTAGIVVLVLEDTAAVAKVLLGLEDTAAVAKVLLGLVAFLAEPEQEWI
jgi:hypothetical protein|tara:strand:- start:161 stop:397 length:237 start_codon:yes stop_codon:yes gene_type:complete